MDRPSGTHIYSFGPFRLHLAGRLLLKNNCPVAIGSRALDLLVILLQNAGSVVGKDALIANLWPDSVVDPAGLRVHMAALRKVLGDSDRYIVTVPQRGYSFVAAVEVSELEAMPPPALRLEQAWHGQLPAMPTWWVGRAELVEALAERLPRQRCVTLVGTGGIGKTTVALVLAHKLRASYPAGAWFVDLAPLSGPHLVPEALASVLGLANDVQNAYTVLLSALRDRPMLLVLDNCEHVIDAAARLAETLLQLPLLHLIITSREPLRIRGEFVQRLDSLCVPPPHPALESVAELLTWPAVQVFAARAEAAHADFLIGENDIPVVADICRRLDGIPLALELAAGRIAEFGLHGLRHLLDDRLRPLARSWRNAPPRHQTLRATLDWSHDLLGEHERLMLRRVSVFKGSFTLEGATDLCEEDALNGLGELLAKSMLTSDEQDELVHYRLLDTTRAYAQERLRESGELPHALRLHAQHCEQLTQQMQAAWETTDALRWVRRYGRRIDDIRAALDWAFSVSGDAELGVRLTVASSTLFYQMSLIGEYRERLQSAIWEITRRPRSSALSELQLSGALGHTLMHTEGITPRVAASFERAYELSGEIESPFWRAKAVGGMWLLRIAQNDLAAALDFESRFQRAQPDGLDRGAAYAHAKNLHLAGRHEEFCQHVRIALDAPQINGRLSHVTLQANRRLAFQMLMCRTLWLQGLSDAALVLATSTADSASEDNSVMYAVSMAFGICPVLLWRGDNELARHWIERLLAHTERHGLMYMRSWGTCYQRIHQARVGSGTLLDLQRDAPLWPSLLDNALTLHDSVIDKGALERADQGLLTWNTPEVWRRQGERLLAADGAERRTEAEALFRRALALAHSQGGLAWELRAATSLARLQQDRGDFGTARETLAPVIQRFTEGHQTVDFQNARGLIDALPHQVAVLAA